MHAVQEALDDAEGDEAPHVDAAYRVGVLRAPAFDAEALPQRKVQLRQLRAAQQRPLSPFVFLLLPLLLPFLLAERVPRAGPVRFRRRRRRGDVPRALGLHLRALDEGGHLGRRGVDGAEAEDVEQEHAAVVEEVADGLADELRVRVGPQRDLPDAVDAVDPGQQAQHGEVPVVVDEVAEADGGEGHVVGVQGRGRRVGGEELDVERVGGVDGDHGFGVVVQVLEEDLAQGVDLAAAAAAVAGEELALLLERAEEGVELADDGHVGAELGVLGQHEAEVEGVGVARVGRGGDVLRVGEDAVAGRGQRGQEAAVAEGRVGHEEGGDRGEVEEGGDGGGGGGGGGDGGGGDLVEDFGTFGHVEGGEEDCFEHFEGFW